MLISETTCIQLRIWPTFSPMGKTIWLVLNSRPILPLSTMPFYCTSLQRCKAPYWQAGWCCQVCQVCLQSEHPLRLQSRNDHPDPLNHNPDHLLWLHHILNPYGNYFIWMLTPCFVSVSAWSEVFLPDPEQQVLEAGGRVWAHFNTIHFWNNIQ